MRSNNPVFARSEEFKSGGYATFDTSRSRTAPPGPVPPAGPSSPEQLEQMYARPSAGPAQTGRMTYDDVIMRTGMMFALLLAGAAISWVTGSPLLMVVGLAGGFALGLVNAFKKEPSPPLILAYAAFQGLFIGGISLVFASRWAGIVPQAVLATLAVFLVALFAFKSGRIRVTPKSTRIFLIALGGYAVFSLVNFGMAMFGVGSSDSVFGPLRPDNGLLGFGIALFAVGLASYSLVMDFDFIQRGVEGGLPQKFAWTGAFALIVTLVWLYIEMLRLIAILRGDD